jgi:hypothetical protein
MECRVKAMKTNKPTFTKVTDQPLWVLYAEVLQLRRRLQLQTGHWPFEIAVSARQYLQTGQNKIPGPTE